MYYVVNVNKFEQEKILLDILERFCGVNVVIQLHVTNSGLASRVLDSESKSKHRPYVPPEPLFPS